MTSKNTHRRGRASRTGAPRKKPGAAAESPDLQGKLWKAGLAALSRGGKLAASSGGAARISESLQGGLKKLEEVFDQRVLDALARASMPSPQEIRHMMERIAQLEAQLDRLTRRRGTR